MSMRNIDRIRQGAGVWGEAPVASDNWTYNDQFYNGTCYSSTQMSILHVVRKLVGTSMSHVRQRVAQGWNQELTCLASLELCN